MSEELRDRWGQPVVDPYPPERGFAEEIARIHDPETLRPRRRRPRWGRWVAAVVVLLLVGAFVAAAPWDAQRRQAYADQWIVWTEPPPARIAELADRLELTETGRRVFFASRPLVDEARSFEEHCPIEADVVLGCYDRGRIYVYDVTDERLAGTVEATAAHELLHAVYERMSPQDARRIDALVAAYVATLPADDQNVLVVAGYPEAQRANEWHSRLGTDYATLPAALEEHYAEVFADRSRVVGFATGSIAQLNDYRSRIEQLSTELETASRDLEARASAYDSDAAAIDAAVDDFNRRAASGDFPSQQQFDRERAALIARQDDLEARRLALNADVDAYNAKLAELQTLDAERAELFSKLDSHSAP